MTNIPADQTISLRPIDQTNWRKVAHLTVTPSQKDFVAEPCYYLTMAAYEDLWHPLAIQHDDQVVGFLMWAVDPADGSCWLGGIIIDQQHQHRGYGKKAVRAALAMLATEHGHRNFALSYNPTNMVAKHIYQSLGFAETDETVDDEVVARLVVG